MFWFREVFVGDVVLLLLFDVVFEGVISDECFQEVVECLCMMLREMCDVDESQDVIEVLFFKIFSLILQIVVVDEEEDIDKLKVLIKVFVIVVESWVVVIVRQFI